MAERIARLYGPALVSASVTSPTTLFTVPTNKKYILRFLTATIPPITGGTLAQGVVFGKTDLAAADLMGAVSITSLASAYTSSTLNLATPMDEAEVLVAATSATLVGATRLDYEASNSNAWNVTSTTDATSLASTANTPQSMDAPTNIYIIAVNSKASAPDAITGIVDNHTNPFQNAASLVTLAGSTTRASIWGAYIPTNPSGAQSFTTTWGGTWTNAFIKAVAVSDAILTVGSPTVGAGVLQTATASGTGETAQGVTMTPTASYGGNTCQILVVASAGTSSSYTGGANSTELGDSTRATPATTAACYFINPAVTDPSATIASAASQTEWVAACIEIPYGGIPAVTLSGVIIE